MRRREHEEGTRGGNKRVRGTCEDQRMRQTEKGKSERKGNGAYERRENQKMLMARQREGSQGEGTYGGRAEGRTMKEWKMYRESERAGYRKGRGGRAAVWWELGRDEESDKSKHTN